MANDTVLVTGGAGFIGSAVVRKLLATGRPVRVLLEPGASTRALEGLAGVDVVPGDVNDEAALDRALAGCATVYHLAAIYRLWMPDRATIWRVNVEGTSTVLLACARAGVRRVVYTSSIAAVGSRPDGRPADESTAFNLYSIADDYILTKYLSERIALRFARGGLPVVVVNPAFPFGPRDHGPTPTGQFIRDTLRGRLPGISRWGFNAVDVDVVAEGHLLAETRGRPGERYLLGDHNVSYRDFVLLLGKVAGIPVPTRVLPDPLTLLIGLAAETWSDWVTHRRPLATYRSMAYVQRNLYFDVTRARSELGLPSRPLEDTLRDAVSFFRSSGMAP